MRTHDLVLVSNWGLYLVLFQAEPFVGLGSWLLIHIAIGTSSPPTSCEPWHSLASLRGRWQESRTEGWTVAKGVMSKSHLGSRNYSRGGNPPSYPTLSDSSSRADPNRSIPQLRGSTSASSNIKTQSKRKRRSLISYRLQRNGKSAWPIEFQRLQEGGPNHDSLKTISTKEKMSCVSVMINLTTCINVGIKVSVWFYSPRMKTQKGPKTRWCRNLERQ